MTHRRKVHALPIGGLFTACNGAWPQASPRRPMVGVKLADGANAMSNFTLPAFLQGLQELGYVDGKNIILHVRSTSGKPQALPGIAAELVHRQVDVCGPDDEALKGDR